MRCGRWAAASRAGRAFVSSSSCAARPTRRTTTCLLELKELADSGIAGLYPPGVHHDDVGLRITETSREAWARPDAAPLVGDDASGGLALSGPRRDAGAEEHPHIAHGRRTRDAGGARGARRRAGRDPRARPLVGARRDGERARRVRAHRDRSRGLPRRAGRCRRRVRDARPSTTTRASALRSISAASPSAFRATRVTHHAPTSRPFSAPHRHRLPSTAAMNLRPPLATLLTTLALARTAHAQTPEPAPDSSPPVAPPPAPVAPAARGRAPAAPALPRLSLPPNGRAAPPTEAATRGDLRRSAPASRYLQNTGTRRTLGPGGGITWFHAFDVPRVHGGD